MKVSVITVCFNASKTIDATLDSVASQSHSDVEHIVIDGASTDGTWEKIKSRSRGLSHFISEPDRGIYDAMNKGIRLASGDVIATMNADDVYADNFVLEQVAHAMESDSLDALYGDVAFFSGEDPEKIIRRYNSGRFSPHRLSWGWMPAHTSLFLRRDLLERVGLYRTDFRIAGDYELIARIFRQPGLKYRYLPKILIRMRTGGVSTKGWRNTLLLNREVLRACRENGIRSNIFKLLSKYPLKALEFLQK